MYKCNKCEKEFKTKQQYNNHQNRKIQCDNIIKCKNCLTVFKRNENLIKHLKRKNKCIKVDLERENIELKHKNEILQLKLNYTDKNVEKKINTNTNVINSKTKENNNNKDNNINNNNNNKIGIVYILSSLVYQLQNIYKIGYSGNTMKERLAGYYTTGHIESIKLKYIYKLETEHYKELENLIFKYLKDYKINNEMYKIDLEKLKFVIEKLNSKIIIKKEIMDKLL